MATTNVLRSRFPRGYARTEQVVAAPARFLDSVGHVAWFVITAIGSIGSLTAADGSFFWRWWRIAQCFSIGSVIGDA